MSGNVVPALDAAHRAALSAGKPMVCECPPAWWFTQVLIESLRTQSEETRRLVAVVPQIEDHDDAVRVLSRNDGLTPVHLSSGIARTSTLLRQNAITSIVTTAPDLAALIKQSALKPDSVTHIVVAWPELYSPTAVRAMEESLAELGSAQRMIFTSNLTGISDLVERYARRAPVYRCGMPETPNPAVKLRYALVPTGRREAALRAALDSLNPATATVWDPAGTDWTLPGLVPAENGDQPVELAVLMDLPSPSVLEAYARRADTTLVFIRPVQRPFLDRLVASATAVKLPSAADRARDRATVVRGELREKLAGGMPIGILTTLEPLLDEFDPVEIAAAALMGTWQKRDEPAAATWTRLRADIGKKDNVRAGDLVGALVNAVGIQPADIGRIDLRDSFAIIEVRPEDAARAVQGLSGTAVRGKRLTARLDDARRAVNPMGGKAKPGGRPTRSRRPSGPDPA